MQPMRLRLASLDMKFIRNQKTNKKHRIVEGIGPMDARIMLIGEAPGRDEESAGIPFIGRAGQLLRNAIEEAELDWSLLRVDNVVQVRPPNNDFSVFYREKTRRNPTEELLQWRQFLLERIQEITPKIVVAVGNEALKALTSLSGITKHQGTQISTGQGMVFPIFHPSYILRNRSKYDSWLESLRLLRELS